MGALKNKTRIEKSSHNVFFYPEKEQHYLSISIYLGDDKYEKLADTSLLNTKKNTSFSITRTGALEPTGFREDVKKKMGLGKDQPDGDRTEKPKAEPFTN